jgi:hypothetical protein
VIAVRVSRFFICRISDPSSTDRELVHNRLRI